MILSYEWEQNQRESHGYNCPHQISGNLGEEFQIK